MGKNISVATFVVPESWRDYNEHWGHDKYEDAFSPVRTQIFAGTGIGHLELRNRNPPLEFQILRYGGEHKKQILIGDEIKVIAYIGKYEKGPLFRVNQEIISNGRIAATKWLDYAFIDISQWPETKLIKTPPRDLVERIQSLEPVDIEAARNGSPL